MSLRDLIKRCVYLCGPLQISYLRVLKKKLVLWIKFGVVNKKSKWWLKREQKCCETLYGLWIERDYESCVVKLLGIDFEQK